MGQVEVRGWSFQLSVRNLDLLLQSKQNLENREEWTDKTTCCRSNTDRNL